MLPVTVIRSALKLCSMQCISRFDFYLLLILMEYIHINLKYLPFFPPDITEK